jgi:hypothetical protein
MVSKMIPINLPYLFTIGWNNNLNLTREIRSRFFNVNVMRWEGEMNAK